MHTLHTAEAGFEAARHLPTLPAGHPQQRLHGHSFVARLRAATGPAWRHFPGSEVSQLREHLAAQVQALDHRLLNDTLDTPTDTQLALWLHERLQADGLTQARVDVQSTARGGVELDPQGHPHLWRRHVLYAAHQLPNVPAGHKCGRLHGHGFEVLLHARQNAQGTVTAERLDALWAPLHRQLDHACLNDLPGLENPTSEVMSGWLWRQLAPQLPELSAVTVYETASCGARHDGTDYRIWKELTLDSALQLRHAPDGSPLRRIHGHTYTLRLHLCAPLDAVMGWTVDFGDVKRLFDPLFKALDHQPLHRLPGLADCDAATLATWVLERARADLPALDRVDLYETPGCGAVVAWNEAAALAL
ncbi:6-carboxytetrahydropterin synthase [Aquabacterium sp. A08]|uniref:6-carboxytetrahydropterin synthase n=1 Tax=Aquabacterium sp. A08 TaxID=2718532 RepID=UPI001420CE6F|nr:6-pyruvoyl tetrahydropterin synthase [Aquabacterium sp. A08]